MNGIEGRPHRTMTFLRLAFMALTGDAHFPREMRGSCEARPLDGGYVRMCASMRIEKRLYCVAVNEPWMAGMCASMCIEKRSCCAAVLAGVDKKNKMHNGAIKFIAGNNC